MHNLLCYGRLELKPEPIRSDNLLKLYLRLQIQFIDGAFALSSPLHIKLHPERLLWQMSIWEGKWCFSYLFAKWNFLNIRLNVGMHSLSNRINLRIIFNLKDGIII